MPVAKSLPVYGPERLGAWYPYGWARLEELETRVLLARFSSDYFESNVIESVRVSDDAQPAADIGDEKAAASQDESSTPTSSHTSPGPSPDTTNSDSSTAESGKGRDAYRAPDRQLNDHRNEAPVQDRTYNIEPQPAARRGVVQPTVEPDSTRERPMNRFHADDAGKSPTTEPPADTKRPTTEHDGNSTTDGGDVADTRDECVATTESEGRAPCSNAKEAIVAPRDADRDDSSASMARNPVAVETSHSSAPSSLPSSHNGCGPVDFAIATSEYAPSPQRSAEELAISEFEHALRDALASTESVESTISDKVFVAGAFAVAVTKPLSRMNSWSETSVSDSSAARPFPFVFMRRRRKDRRSLADQTELLDEVEAQGCRSRSERNMEGSFSRSERTTEGERTAVRYDSYDAAIRWLVLTDSERSDEASDRGAHGTLSAARSFGAGVVAAVAAWFTFQRPCRTPRVFKRLLPEPVFTGKTLSANH